MRITILFVLSILAGSTMAHSENEPCSLPRFVELAWPYTGNVGRTESVNSDGIVNRWPYGWRPRPTRYFHPDAIESMSQITFNRTNAPNLWGVIVRVKDTTRTYTEIDPNVERNTWTYVTYYFLDGARIGDMLHRWTCHHPYQAPSAARESAQNRNDARRWEVLRALESLQPDDLL